MQYSPYSNSLQPDYNIDELHCNLNATRGQLRPDGNGMICTTSGCGSQSAVGNSGVHPVKRQMQQMVKKTEESKKEDKGIAIMLIGLAVVLGAFVLFEY